MENIPYYGASNIRSSLKYNVLVDAIEKALADFSRGENGGVDQPLRATTRVADHNGWNLPPFQSIQYFALFLYLFTFDQRLRSFLMAMPAYMASRRALACKLVTFYPDNGAKRLDTHMATILLFDEATGMIKAVSLCHLSDIYSSTTAK